MALVERGILHRRQDLGAIVEGILADVVGEVDEVIPIFTEHVVRDTRKGDQRT